ncbi:MAG: hypothetical protein IJ802_03535 [Kiritimatiellae bacterium]|nr:hypothetical protein [Kiritimatiellia bacterium]
MPRKFVFPLIFLAAACLPAAADVARIVPQNAYFYEITDETGAKTYPMRVETIASEEISGQGWRGERKKRTTTLERADGRKYVFEKGLLKEIYSKDGEKTVFPANPVFADSLKDLFPPDEQSLAEAMAHKEEFDIWRKGGRLRIFYGNPNKTAVLFVFLALCGAWLAGKTLPAAKAKGWRAKAIFTAAALAATAGVWGVAATASRGALVALAVGGAVMAVRGLASWKRFGGALLAAVLAAGIIAASPAGERFTSGLAKVDGANALRVNILKAFPRMLRDAPDGWGWRKSGLAYSAYYRPVEELRTMHALVNTHFTWMAEMPWAGRVAYVFLAFALLLALFLARKNLALGLWTAMFTAGMFNHVGEEWTLWLAPAAALAWPPLKMGKRKWCACIAAALAASACINATLYRLGATKKGEVRISKTGPLLEMGIAADGRKVHVLADHYAAGGWNFSGKEFEEYYEENPGAKITVFAESIAALPKKVERLVLTGRHCEEWLDAMARGEKTCSAEQVVAISPSCEVARFAEAAEKTHLRVIMGEFAAMRQQMPEPKPPYVRVVKGAELYIPGYIAIALGGK